MCTFVRIIFAAIFFRVVKCISQPPRGHVCESHEPIRQESGWNGIGRAVDPIRLFGSKSLTRADGTKVVVFVGADDRTLCCLKATDGAFLWAVPLLANSSSLTTTAEPSTLALTQNSAFIVVVVSVATELEVYTRIGWVQHQLQSGQEVAHSFFDGTCQSNPNDAGGSALSWLQPKWWQHLEVGESVDYYYDVATSSGQAGAASWVEATLVNRTNEELVLLVATTGEAVHVPASAAAAICVQPRFSRRPAHLRALPGDYIEHYIRGTWQLARVSEVLGSNDPRNGYGTPLVRFDYDNAAAWYPFDGTTVASCGAHLRFADSPRHFTVMAEGNQARVAVLLERLTGLPPLVALYDVPDDTAEMLPDVSPRSMPAAWVVPLIGCTETCSSSSDAFSASRIGGGSTIPELFTASQNTRNNATSSEPVAAAAGDDGSLIFAACGGSEGQRVLQAIRLSTGQVQWRLRLDTNTEENAPVNFASATGGASPPLTSTVGMGASSSGWTRNRRRRRRMTTSGKLPMRRAEGAAVRALGNNGQLVVWAEAQSTLVLVRPTGRIEPWLFVNDDDVTLPKGAHCPASSSSHGGDDCVWIEVPQRTQFGPTCGLHALSMVLHFWHQQSSSSSSVVAAAAVPPVGDEWLGSPLAQAMIQSKSSNSEKNVKPPRGSLLEIAQSRGYSALGEMFNASQLAAVASAVGYAAAVHSNPSIDDIRRLLSSGHPILAPLDVTPAGNPGINNGESAHYAVIVGLAPSPVVGGSQDNPLLLVRHSWNLRALHVWTWAELEASSKQLSGTSFYGGPSDLEVPLSVYTQGVSGLKRPARCRLGPLKGQPMACSIAESLAAKFIEVVPSSDMLLGKRKVYDEGPA